MKDAFQYVLYGILGTIILGCLIGLIAFLPVIPAAIVSLLAAVGSIAIFLFPGALLVYGFIYWKKRTKE